MHDKTSNHSEGFQARSPRRRMPKREKRQLEFVDTLVQTVSLPFDLCDFAYHGSPGTDYSAEIFK